MGQASIVGPLTFSIMLYAIMAVGAAVLLHFIGLRAAHVYVIGNSKEVARFSGVRVRRTR